MNYIQIGIYLTLFLFGTFSGYSIQSFKYSSLEKEYTAFITKTQLAGEIAKKDAENKEKAYEAAKENTNQKYSDAIRDLVADNNRLRQERSSRRYVPGPPSTSKRPDLACFDRRELEQAIQRFTDEVSGIVEQGDKERLGLNAAKFWVQDLQRTK